MTTDQPALTIRQRLYSPGVAFILAVVGIVATVAASWWFSRSSVEPVYARYGTTEVARKASPRLAVQWDGKPIENLCVANVAIWNRGRQPLRATDLPIQDPLRIVLVNRGRLLEIRADRASRQNLKMSATQNGNLAYLRIEGGDALETDDGVGYALLYTGECSKPTIEVQGRIIGTSYGAVPVSLDVSFISTVMTVLAAVPMMALITFVLDSSQRLRRSLLARLLYTISCILLISGAAGAVAVMIVKMTTTHLPSWCGII